MAFEMYRYAYDELIMAIAQSDVNAPVGLASPALYRKRLISARSEVTDASTPLQAITRCILSDYQAGAFTPPFFTLYCAARDTAVDAMSATTRRSLPGVWSRQSVAFADGGDHRQYSR